MKHPRWLVLLLALIVSCIAEKPGTRTACDGNTQRVRTRFAVDNGFSPNERAALQRATDNWFVFSESHVDVSLSYALDTDEDHPHIYRVQSWMQVVKDQDKKATVDPAKPFIHLGWESAGTIFLVIDRIRPEHLAIIATHELGHAAGLAWPDCLERLPQTDCHHSPDPTALMAPEFNGQQGFNDADKQFCRVSCLCP